VRFVLLALLALTVTACGTRDAATFALAPVRPGGPLGFADLEVREGKLQASVPMVPSTATSSHSVSCLSAADGGRA